MIIEYLQMAFTENPSSNNPSQQSIKREVIVPEKFRSDIGNLKGYGLQLEPGISIEVALSEMLTICPRERRRVDSYKALVSYLRDEFNITLIIKSQKRKNYEKN